jgi:chloramphenicol O-acetyltransferase type B
LSDKPPVSLQELYPQYRIGPGSYGGLRVFDWKDGTKIEVGAYCSFSFGVDVLLGGEHRMDWVTTFPFMELFGLEVEGHPKSKGDVWIGSDVWVGSQAMILAGVKIGHGACIGARSVVTKDVEPYSVVVGHPAKHVRWRFEAAAIGKLLAIRWWEWPTDRIERAAKRLLQPDVWDFINAVERGEL